MSHTSREEEKEKVFSETSSVTSGKRSTASKKSQKLF